MAAPDKIYASFINNGKVMAGCSIHPIINSSEYLRNDALLEWAKDWQNELDDSLGASMVHHVLNEVIKKIESL